MPKLPERDTPWSRKRDPEKCPSQILVCPRHGRAEHRKYVKDKYVSWVCVHCSREVSNRNNRERRAGRLPRWHPLQQEVDTLAPTNPICPRCFLETANNGTCGCDE